MAAKNRYRLMYKFWLDMNKPEEEAIAETVEILKEKRSFAKTIRDGIRLICDLRSGNVDALEYLFPWIVDHYTQTPPSNGGNDDSGQQVTRDDIEHLEKLILANGSAPGMVMNGNGGVQSSQPGNARPIIAEPEFNDDDTLLIEAVETTTEQNAKAANNFLNSMMALQS